jgi:hypothetical protein
MPRDGTNTYNLPFPDVVAGTTIASPVYNGFTHDIAQDLNTPRPISAGGTGATSADGALTALGGEKAQQLVTNYDSHVWLPGSFYSATTATGEPVNGHAFSGIVYQADSNNIVVEARDSSDGKLYVRRKVAGSWGAWQLDVDLSGVSGDIALKVAKAGDTMSGFLTLHANPDAAMKAATKQYVDAVDTAKVAKAGDTMTGSLVIDPASASAQLTLDKSATGGANTSAIVGRVDGLMRWQLQLGNGSTETGGNAGSRFLLSAYDDAGAFLSSPLTGLRETGLLSVVGDPTAALGIATKQYADTKLAIAGGQTLTGGFALTPNNLGNIAASFTPNPLLGNYQYGTNNGAATWNAPTVDCAMDILVTNSASAGTITFSGYTALPTNVGDTLNNTNTNKFIISLRRINAIATYTVKALQ